MVTRDRGAALLWSVSLMAMLFLAAVAGAAVGAVAISLQRVEMTADLAALAAARSGDCAAAVRTAEANGAAVVECAWDGTDVIVRLSRPLPTVARFVRREDVSAIARAGLATSSDPTAAPGHTTSP